MASRLNHMAAVVAQAQPSPPRRGSPKRPYTSTALSRPLSSRAVTAITIIGLVWFRLAL